MSGVKKPARSRSRRAPKRHRSGKADAASRPVGSSSDHDTTDVMGREGAVTAREGTATSRERAARVREDAAGQREETATFREATVGAREEAALVRSELEQRMAQVREANARLVVGAVRAQTMVENAEEANHLKDEFLATVSHELRTPLNAVLGWARMLGSQQLSPDRTRHAIAVIERNAATLAHLIEDLLDMSRIVAGTMRLAP